MSEFGFDQYLENNGQNLTKFCIHIIIDKIYVRIVTCHQFFKQSYAPENIFVLGERYGRAIVRSSYNSSLTSARCGGCAWPMLIVNSI